MDMMAGPTVHAMHYMLTPGLQELQRKFSMLNNLAIGTSVLSFFAINGALCHVVVVCRLCVRAAGLTQLTP